MQTAPSPASVPSDTTTPRGDISSRYTLAVLLAKQRWSKPAGLHALDLYSGSGYGSVLLARKLAMNVTGVERDVALLASAKKHSSDPRVTYLPAADDNALPLAAYDLITCFDTLDTVEQHGAFVRRLALALKPGGLLLVSACNECQVPLCANADVFPAHRTHFTPESLDALSTETGLLTLAARFGQSFYSVAADGRVFGLAPGANFLPQLNAAAPQVLVHVFQRNTTTPRPPLHELTWVAEGGVVRGGGKGIEHPIGLSPRAELYEDCQVGHYTYLNHGSVIYPNTRVGRFCSIGREVHIGPHNHPIDFLSTHPFQFDPVHFARDPDYAAVQHVPFNASARPTTVGHDVWIGTHALILQGVTIGHGAIVGAGAIVTRDVPPYAIVAGNPARILRYRFDEAAIHALLELAWWDRDLATIRALPFNDIAACIRLLRETTPRS